MIGSFVSIGTASLAANTGTNKNHSTTVYKTITNGQTLVFEVAKHLNLHKYSHQTRVRRCGLFWIKSTQGEVL